LLHKVDEANYSKEVVANLLHKVDEASYFEKVEEKFAS